MTRKKSGMIGPEDCEEQFLVCKKCGYKQYDITTVLMYKVKYPGVPPYDIPYECCACMDNEEVSI